MATSTQIAQTIADQLGSKALYMLGAKNLAAGSNYLQFQFSGCKKYSYMQIILDADDTYTVRLFKMRKFEVVNDKKSSWCIL